MSTQLIYLVIRSDKSVRIVKRPRLMADEVAVPIRLNYPDTWGRYLSEGFTVNVPDFAPEVHAELTPDG
jgi:hypothetical protein